MTKRVCYLEKACSLCGKVRPLSAFDPHHLRFDGRDTRCRRCKRASPSYRRAQAKWRAKYIGSDRYRESARRSKLKSRARPEARIGKRMSEMLRRYLNGRKAYRPWHTLVGYTPEELRAHLERQFTKGMTWDAFMRGEIHIDHIVPQADFRFESRDEEGFRQCWALTNLRPMWARDNIAKGARRVTLC